MSTQNLTRAQLVMFNTLGDRIRLSEDDRRRALELDDRSWLAWNDFLSDGPLPAEPPLPEMLRRLGKSAYHLATMSDSHGIAA